MNKQDMRDKIRALLAKAESTDFEGEANTLFQKAAELMEKYQIEAHELGELDEIGDMFGIKGQPGAASYKCEVQSRLASYYGAKVVRHYTAHNRWVNHIFGPESVRITLDLMTEYVWSQVLAAGKRLPGCPQANARQVAKALVLRLAVLTQERKEQSHAPGTSFSLVVVDNVMSRLKAAYPETFKINKRPIKTTADARTLAAQIKIDRQISTPTPLALNG